MTDFAEAVGEMVALAGGSIEGKTRLQKSEYLLESHGVGYGFVFAYHYYGPYSELLALAAQDAAALQIVTTEMRESKQGVRYLVFNLGPCAPRLAPSRQSSSHVKARKQILDVLKKYDSVALELAATADFLARTGHASDPWTETIRRKKEKASPERVGKAKTLLKQLDAMLM